jgi:tRNA(Ile)-lysidine synthase
MSPNEYKFYKICLEKKFFDKKRRVLVAVSGGQDSMTLFSWLYDLREKLEVELGVVHINHKVRKESDDEENYLRAKMAELKIPFYFAELPANLSLDFFTEEKAREFRYNYFKKVMKEEAYDAIVTAHHKADQAETVFMRLVTGRRLRHLRGMEERQAFEDGELIRPLLDFEKSELDAETFFEDETNHENEHLRNRVRNLYLPELAKENPRIIEALVDLSDETSRAMNLIEQSIKDLQILGERISLSEFRLHSEDLQYFILQDYFAGFQDLQLNKRTFNEVLKIIQRPQQYNEVISKNYFFIKNSKEFYISKVKSEKKVEIMTENPNDSEFLKINLPIDVEYKLRKREAGDKIKLHGQTKMLKKFFIDNKVALEDRDVPVIAVGSEIYAIPVMNIVSDLSFSLQSATIKLIIWTRVHIEEGEA